GRLGRHDNLLLRSIGGAGTTEVKPQNAEPDGHSDEQNAKGDDQFGRYRSPPPLWRRRRRRDNGLLPSRRDRFRRGKVHGRLRRKRIESLQLLLAHAPRTPGQMSAEHVSTVGLTHSKSRLQLPQLMKPFDR